MNDAARILLAAIRLVNGTTALLAPTLVARRLRARPEAAPVTFYPLRLFGVRTIVIGAELLARDPELRAKALRAAVPIHASDTLAAFLGGVRKELPRRTAIMLTLLSAGNTALALVARRAAR